MYKNKGILVIGGGILQMPALKLCKKLGLTTYLIDGDENCYSKKYSDNFYKIDIRDFNSCLKIGKKLKEKNKIHGVFTQGTDVEHVVAYLAEKLNFSGLTFEGASNCNNKLKCRKILFNSGIDKTPFYGISSIDELNSIYDKLSYPCYVKPTNNSASRGVTKVHNKKELFESVKYAFSMCYDNPEVIIENEIIGEEYSVDSVVIDGTLYPCGISDRIFLKKDSFAVQVGSRTPSLLSSEIQDKIYSMMQDAANKLKVNNSAFKGDLVVDKKGQISVIEFAGRTSGGFDSQYRKPLSFGINILKVVIDLSLGNKIDFNDLIPKWIKWSSTYSKITEPGLIKEIKNLNYIKNIDGVEETFLILKEGDVVEKAIDCAKRFNYFISQADTLDDLLDIENKIEEKLILKIEKL